MKKKDSGFSVVELLLIIVVIIALAGLGYMFYKRKHTTTASAPAKTSQTQTAAPAAGTSASIDSLTSQDASSEASIDKQHTSNENTAAQSANSAAANVGGAYNESSL